MLIVIFFVIGIYLNIGDENEGNPLIDGNKGVNPNGHINEKSTSSEKEGVTKVTEGLGVTIGKKAKEIEKEYGKPDRIDMSAYGYEWWVYKKDYNNYFQLAVENGKVVSAYGIGDKVNVAPFKIGQSIDAIYSSLYVEPTIDIEVGDSSYRFELSEEDMNMRPLIDLGNIYVQLYLDKFTGTVSSVRFLNDSALLKQKPYELTYHGKLVTVKELSKEDLAKVEVGNEQQIFDITNIMRSRFKLNPLEWDGPTAEVAYLHSREMTDAPEGTHVSETKGDLEKRLDAGHVKYKAAGENIAANYVDAAAVMEGWLNSKGHRDAMLNEEFTGLGVGVYKRYYTQNFIKK
ncbi:CAP domain-containing protein [Peribacillus simplex]|uniref:CAP domain-containing protein n=1 Tax=Peribacillus simplex TaxID=1478 RepID=UPI00298E8B98|nr:CAP domain-containing protein [Peribacillus simplex]MDW7613199.1 CAP domain-containing protein [Peribacillus simplex]